MRGPGGYLLCLNAGFHPQGHHRGLRGTGALGAPLPAAWAGTGAAHSPSSSCLGASLAGSRLRGRRWHLASRILKRAFCLMRVAGVPGESPHPVAASPVGRGVLGAGHGRGGLRVRRPARGPRPLGAGGEPLRPDCSP